MYLKNLQGRLNSSFGNWGIFQLESTASSYIIVIKVITGITQVKTWHYPLHNWIICRNDKTPAYVFIKQT